MTQEFLNASSKNELFIEVIKNDKAIQYPIKTKTIYGIEKQVNEFWNDEDVQSISLVRYWNETKEGGVDCVIEL
jgi:hypothetical protein